MSGLPDLNFPAFHAEADRLRMLGHEVINPAEINADPSKGWNDCMRADIRELVTCDAIRLLPGWKKSRGATLEHHIATTLGMAVHADETIGVPPVATQQRPMSDREWAAQSAGLREGCTVHVPSVGSQ
jgi:hypothetical protein